MRSIKNIIWRCIFHGVCGLNVEVTIGLTWLAGIIRLARDDAESGPRGNCSQILVMQGMVRWLEDVLCEC